MFARFGENPAMTLQVIKETKRYGRTDGRTDARTHGRTDGRTDGQRENSIPPTNKVCGGYKECKLTPDCDNSVSRTISILLIQSRLTAFCLCIPHISLWLIGELKALLCPYRSILTFWLLSSDFFFYKINIFKNSFRNPFIVSNGMEPDQDQQNVGPDQGPNCLQRLSTDDKSHS